MRRASERARRQSRSFFSSWYSQTPPHTLHAVPPRFFASSSGIVTQFLSHRSAHLHSGQWYLCECVLNTTSGELGVCAGAGVAVGAGVAGARAGPFPAPTAPAATTTASAIPRHVAVLFTPPSIANASWTGGARHGSNVGFFGRWRRPIQLMAATWRATWSTLIERFSVHHWAASTTAPMSAWA